MNVISGKVLDEESGFGIPGLLAVLVVVFDVDPSTTRGELVSTGSEDRSSAVLTTLRQRGHRDRLGSALTDGTGAFTLTYKDDAVQVRNAQGRRPALFLAILASKHIDTSGNSRVLFVSSAVRQNAGRTEQYLIRLGTDQLLKAGVMAPATSSDCPPDSRDVWKDYNHQQEFEHDLINRKTTWSLTAQGLLFTAYGLTFSSKVPQGLSGFRAAVAVAGLAVAALTFIGVASLVLAKWISYKGYRDYFGHGDCLPGPEKGKRLKWGAAGKLITISTMVPDFGIPLVLIVVWSVVLA